MSQQQSPVTQRLHQIKETLINLVKPFHPDLDREGLISLIENEIFYFDYWFLLKPELNSCDLRSVEYAFRQKISKGLSFDKELNHVYVKTRKNKDASILEMEVQTSVDGEVLLRKMAGSLSMVYATIQYDQKKFVKSVKVTAKIPTYDMAGSMVSEHSVTEIYDLTFFRKLQGYSHRQNAKDGGNTKTLSSANANYYNYNPEDIGAPPNPVTGGINPGFAAKKAMRHFLNSLNLERSKIHRNGKPGTTAIFKSSFIKSDEQEEVVHEEEATKSNDAVSYQAPVESDVKHNNKTLSNETAVFGNSAILANKPMESHEYILEQINKQTFNTKHEALIFFNAHLDWFKKYPNSADYIYALQARTPSEDGTPPKAVKEKPAPREKLVEKKAEAAPQLPNLPPPPAQSAKDWFTQQPKTPPASEIADFSSIDVSDL